MLLLVLTIPAFNIMITNKSKTIKKKKSPLLAKIKFEPTFFSGSLAVCLFASASGRGGRKGGSGGIPPAEPVNEIGSDFFKYTPPVGKSPCWLALCEGSPADFRRKIEFFVFVLQSKTPEAGFSKLNLEL
ncbi:MAG: hypothetical protein KatS3mg091_324 [Patescibacteria group bacterium]|nr:MAG: hypothetical protein KatS3mg091_324 [Patescibacteria group bacterium]